MARYKGLNWNLPDSPASIGYPEAHLAVLMDIRDELKELNRMLRCPNFQRLPRILDRISANTRKKRSSKR